MNSIENGGKKEKMAFVVPVFGCNPIFKGDGWCIPSCKCLPLEVSGVCHC